MTRNNTENWFQNQLHTLQFCLRVQAKQFHPRGSTVLSHVRWSKIGESLHLDIWTQVYVLSLLVQLLSTSTLRKRRGRFKQQYHSLSLQISIFNFHGEMPSSPQCCLISSLGSTAQFTRRAVCSTVSSFNLIIIAAPVATLPCILLLFIPCQASLIGDRDILLFQVLPASPQLLYISLKGTLTSCPAIEIKVSRLLSSFWPLILCNS